MKVVRKRAERARRSVVRAKRVGNQEMSGSLAEGNIPEDGFRRELRVGEAGELVKMRTKGAGKERVEAYVLEV